MSLLTDSDATADMSLTRHRWKNLWLPVLLLLCLTLPHLDQGDFRRDTGRYAAVGRLMWSEGRVAPYLNPDTPYFNKPPLALLLHGWFLHVFGVSLVVARLPSVLAAAGVVIFTVLAARQLGSRTEAVTSGMVLATTYEFFRRTREISLDLWQLFFLMAAVVLTARALKTGRGVWLLGAGVPLGLALLCKPLIAFIAVPVLAGWVIVARRGSLLGWLLLGALPLALLVALPWHWHMYACFGDSFLAQYFGREVVDRARGLHLQRPIYYYLTENAATYWPWLAGLVYALYWRARRPRLRAPRRDLVLLAALWLVPWLICLSVFPDKKPNYALPLYPALAWIVAAGLTRLPWRRLRVWYASGFRWLAPAAAVIALAIALMPIRIQNPPDADWAAVLAWLRDHQISARAVAHAGLDENELCYFYLKTGYWLHDWKSAGGTAPWILVPATAATNVVSPARRLALNAGKYQMFEPATPRSPLR